MNWRILILFPIQLMFYSCQTKTTRYKAVVDNVEGLETGSKVIYNDRTIGFITDMDLFNDSVIVSFQLNKDNYIPKGSKFYVREPLLGENALYVESSGSRVAMTISDTGRGYRDVTKFFSKSDDSTTYRKRRKAIKKMAEGFKEFLDASKDSTK